jgi:hypothetical protein
MIVSQGRVVNTQREGSLTRFCFSYLQFLFLGLASWVLDGMLDLVPTRRLLSGVSDDELGSGETRRYRRLILPM